jgi:hypothetical protein
VSEETAEIAGSGLLIGQAGYHRSYLAMKSSVYS